MVATFAGPSREGPVILEVAGRVKGRINIDSEYI